jgi:glycosyltransferase involved in cell wall biosynthesis
VSDAQVWDCLPLNILRVSSDLYPSVHGGLGIHVHELSKAQANQGNAVVVLTLNGRKREETYCTDGYIVEQFKNTGNILGNSFCFRLFIRIWRARKQFDVIHAHSHLFLTTNFCALCRRMGSSPLIITNHGIQSQTAPPWLQGLYLKTLGKWTLRSADLILCYTVEEKHALILMGIPGEKIAVIHNGVDPDLFLPSGTSPPKKQILWIGRYVKGKGIEYLVNAFLLLTTEYPELTLLLIGQGPLEDSINEKIKPFDGKKPIVRKNFVENKDLPGVYQQSLMLVLPSLYEGVPRTILEAMSCGIPVICTDLPHLIPLVDACGLFVPPRDAEALARAMKYLLENRDIAARFGEQGRARILDRYAWVDTVRQTTDLCALLIERAKNPVPDHILE